MLISRDTPITREEIIDFLGNLGIKASLINEDEYGYSRTISFSVYNTKYRIIWFCNMSTLEIGDHYRSPQIPFRYMYFDRTFPLVGGNRSIGFSYNKYDKETPFDREFPYEVFRIPIEIKNEPTV